MKRFVKLFTCLLIMLLAMTAFTACGKTEEEKALDDLREHIYAEAAQDGVDLDALLESEYQASQDRLAEYEKQNQEKQDFRALVETRLPALTAAHNSYKTATTGRDILSAAQEYNRLYTECLALAEDQAQTNIAETLIYKATGRYGAIAACIFQAKAALADADFAETYDNVFFYIDSAVNDSKFVCTTTDQAGRLQVLVLMQDGSVYTPDLSAIYALDPSYCEVAGVTANSLIVTAAANADFLKYEFSFSDPACAGMRIDFDTQLPDYDFWQLWSTQLDEFQVKESREASYKHP